jgi:hypothetical protein
MLPRCRCMVCMVAGRAASSAIGFAQPQQIQQAQWESWSPMPSSFERYPDAQLVEYQR